MFSRIFPKVFRTSILKENLAMDVPYFIKEHLWMSASDESTLKKNLVEVNPRQSWPWKQNCTTVVAVVMILEVWATEKVCWRWIFWKKIKPSNMKWYVTITILEWLMSAWCIYLAKILTEKHLNLSNYLNEIGPQLQRQPAYKSLLDALGPNCHLTPKIGHLQKTEVALKSKI